MQVGFLVLADSSEAFNGKVYALGAGWSQLRLPLPSPWGFAIAIGVDVPWDATNQRHAFSLHIEDPDGNLLGDPFEAEFEQGRPAGIVSGQDQRVVMSLATQVNFERAGPHAVVVKVGGKEIGRTRFYVVNQPAS